MLTHYVDLALVPDPEFVPAHLMGALYSKLHRALVALQAEDIAVSFPGYQRQRLRQVGTTLRLLGPEVSLQRLLASDWLRGMRDHVQVTEVQQVPVQVEHRQLSRRQFQSNVERLRRRRMRRHGESEAAARAAIPDHAADKPDLPYVQLRSSSTGQPFSLFLVLGEPQPEARAGRFNSYGLSAEATVPWF